MIRLSVKATRALEQPPAVKPLLSRWLSDDDKPSQNAGLSRLFGTRTDTSRQMLVDWPLHRLAIYPNHNDCL